MIKWENRSKYLPIIMIGVEIIDIVNEHKEQMHQKKGNIEGEKNLILPRKKMRSCKKRIPLSF